MLALNATVETPLLHPRRTSRVNRMFASIALTVCPPSPTTAHGVGAWAVEPQEQPHAGLAV